MVDKGQTDELEKTPGDDRANLLREIEERDHRIAALEGAAALKESELAVARQAAGALENRLADAGKEIAQAVAAYKGLIIELNPGMLTELITGNTVAEVNESLKSARALVERVKQDIEAKASAARVPAGAPQRGSADLSALSPREKIQIAIGGKK